MSREERALEAEQQGENFYDIGLPSNDELREAYENRPASLSDYEWDAFVTRSQQIENRIEKLFQVRFD